MNETQCANENITYSKIKNDTNIRNVTNLIGIFCSKVFDGFFCWDKTPAGATAYQGCPTSIYEWFPFRTIYKVCDKDGNWLESEFQNCILINHFHFRDYLFIIRVCGQIFSIFELCRAMWIFYSYKLLRNTRTKILFNVFLVSTLHSITWVVWYILVVMNEYLLLENPYFCTIITLLYLYFLCATYMWLHNIWYNIHVSLVVVFLNQMYALRLYLLIGWVVPLFCILFFYCLRLLRNDIDRCMIDKYSGNFFMLVPVYTSVLLSSYFLIRILWILAKQAKCKSVPGQVLPICASICRIELSKTILSGIILIPLITFNFIMNSAQPRLESNFDKVLGLIAAFASGFQGYLVALRLCFQNKEVRTHMRKNSERKRRLQMDLRQISEAYRHRRVRYAEHRF